MSVARASTYGAIFRPQRRLGNRRLTAGLSSRANRPLVVKVTSNGDILLVGVTGGTGQRAVKGLLDGGLPASRLQALSRDPTKESCIALSNLGVQIVEGSLEDPGKLSSALEGVDMVYCHGTSADTSMADPVEVTNAKTLVEACKDARVSYIVYNSSAAPSDSGIPHIEQKHAVEDLIKESGIGHTFLRATLFMEEFFKKYTRPSILKGSFPFSVPGDKELALVNVRDMGRVASKCLQNPGDFRNNTIEVASDKLTVKEMAAAFAKAQGAESIEHNELWPWFYLFYFLKKELFQISQFYRTTEWSVNPALLRKDFELSTFEEFLADTDWANPEIKYEDLSNVTSAPRVLAGGVPSTASLPTSTPSTTTLLLVRGVPMPSSLCHRSLHSSQRHVSTAASSEAGDASTSDAPSESHAGEGLPLAAIHRLVRCGEASILAKVIHAKTDSRGPVPVVLFLSGADCPHEGYAWLAERLAGTGSVVVVLSSCVVPFGARTCLMSVPYDFAKLATLEQYKTGPSADGVAALLAELASLNDESSGSALAGCLDLTRVALGGHSTGGRAALDLVAYGNIFPQVKAAFTYGASMVNSGGPGIAFAPPNSVLRFEGAESPPVLLMGGTRDGVSAALSESKQDATETLVRTMREGARAGAAAAHLVIFKGANHMVLCCPADPTCGAVQADLPLEHFTAEAFRTEIGRTVLSFLKQHLLSATQGEWTSVDVSSDMVEVSIKRNRGSQE